MRTFLVIFFGLMISFGNAQKSESKKQFEDLFKDVSSEYMSKVNFVKAQQFYFEKQWDSVLVYSARQLSKKTNKTELQDLCFFIRGVSFSNKRIFEEAEAELSKISDYFVFRELTDMHLGTIALEQDQFQKSLEYFLQIEEYTEEQLTGINKINIQNSIGIAYLFSNEYEKASKYLDQVIDARIKSKDTIVLIDAYTIIANVYYEKYQDKKAIENFTKAYELSKNIDDFSKKYTVAENMSVVEKNRDNFKEAYKYQAEAQQWKDSLNDQNKIYEVAKVEKQFAVATKQKEVDLLQLENEAKETQRNAFILSAVVLFLLLGVSYYFYRQKVRTNKIISSQNETLDNLNATKDRLFSIVSHDLRSSVNALKTSNRTLISSLETKNIDKLEGLLTSNSNIVNGAYNLLDNLLNWAMLQTKQTYFLIEPHRLHHIVEQVAYNYEALFTEKDIVFNNEVSKKAKVLIDKESFKIILRNLLDNAIKFTQKNGEISVFTKEENDYHKLIVQDNGLGMSADKKAELLSDSQLLSKKENEDIIGTGLGMQLCKSLIKKNNGKLDIDTQFGVGTKIIISLPKANVDG